MLKTQGARVCSPTSLPERPDPGRGGYGETYSAIGNISKPLVAERVGGIYVRIAYVGIDYTLVALWQERTFGYGYSSYSCFVDHVWLL